MKINQEYHEILLYFERERNVVLELEHLWRQIMLQLFGKCQIKSNITKIFPKIHQYYFVL